MSAMGGKMSSEELAAIEVGMAQGENAMSMVERVARAMCESEGIDPDADWRGWRSYVRQARAAITAMQRTEAERIVALLGELGIKRTEITAQHMAAVHSFLVDAALKEEPKP